MMVMIDKMHAGRGFLAANLPFLAYLAVCLIWGSTFLAIRIAVQDLPPMTAAGVRFLLAGGLMYAYVRWKGLPFPSPRETRQQSLVGICLLWSGNGLVMVGSQWVHSSVAALLFATVPLFMALMSLFMLKGEKINLTGWLGLAVGFAGVAILVLRGGVGQPGTLLGMGIILLGAASWAFGSVYSKRVRTSVPMMVTLTIQTVAGGVLLLAVGILSGELKGASLSLDGVLAILYLIFFGSLLGYNAYIYLLSVWPAARVSTYAYVNPLVAILLGSLILGEPVGLSVLIASATILAGVFLVQLATAGKS